jgi:undecaprenyl-diphosphatase
LLDTLSIFGAKYLFIVIAGIALVYFLKQPRSRQRRIVIFAALTLPLTYIVSKIGALLYNDPRPFVAGHFIPVIPHEPDNGFPSDHVLLCAGIAAVIYPSSKSLSLILWALTLLVSMSRVHTGLHHPVDIIGSIIMAIVVAAIVYRVGLMWLGDAGSTNPTVKG